MMKYVVILIVLLFLLALYVAHREDVRNDQMILYEKEQRCNKVIESKSIEKVQEVLADYKATYEEVKPRMDYDQRRFSESDIAELEDHLHDLEEAKWEKMVDKYITDFSLDYEYIMTADEVDTVREVETLLKKEKHCISSWQNYFGVELDQFQTTIYPKQYLREYMGAAYDPCMESHDALEKKLEERIQHIRPEYKRKQKLYSLIMKYVTEKESVKRSDLYKATFDGFTPDELKCCYHELVRRNRLVEIKLGSRLFVYLSDSEKARRQRKGEKSC